MEEVNVGSDLTVQLFADREKNVSILSPLDQFQSKII